MGACLWHPDLFYTRAPEAKRERILFLPLALALVPLAAGSAHAQSYTGVITLDPIPPRAGAGDPVYFSGWLGTASGYDVSEATVYVKDDVSFGRDRVVATLFTGGDGRF